MKIFQLKSLEITGQKNRNGGHKVWEEDMGLFESKEKAENTIQSAIKERPWSNFFAFFIYERQLNLPCLNDAGYQSVTSYLADGTFYCYSPCDSACVKPFKGRPAESIRLRKGDLAWYWSGDHIEPCLVGFQPYTEEQYADYCKERGHSADDPDFHPFDGTDDCYLVYNYNNDHNHPECWQLFPFSGTLTQGNMDRLLASRKWWQDGCRK